MALPNAPSEFTRVQYEFYKSAGKLAKLWYALTVIALILYILSTILLCVGGFLVSGSIMVFIQSLLDGFSGYGY